MVIELSGRTGEGVQGQWPPLRQPCSQGEPEIVQVGSTPSLRPNKSIRSRVKFFI